MQRLLFPALVAALGLVLAAPAAAEAPTKVTTTATFEFVDEEACPFPITVMVDRTRTTTTFADGDVKRHTELLVTSSANGKTIVSRTTFNVFIDADSPDMWVITGTFEKAQLHGRTIWLQSGRLVYDLEADELIDPRPGPLAQPPPLCEVLAA